MPEKFESYSSPEEVEKDPIKEIQKDTIRWLNDLFIAMNWETIELDNWTMQVEYTDNLDGTFKAVLAMTDKEWNTIWPFTITSEGLMSLDLLELWMTEEIAKDGLLKFDKKMKDLLDRTKEKLQVIKNRNID